MTPGDLVELSRRDYEFVTLYEAWGGKGKPFPKRVGEIKSGEFAIVLESLSHQGGNGCKLLTESGKVGWANLNLLKTI